MHISRVFGPQRGPPFKWPVHSLFSSHLKRNLNKNKPSTLLVKFGGPGLGGACRGNIAPPNRGLELISREDRTPDRGLELISRENRTPDRGLEFISREKRLILTDGKPKRIFLAFLVPQSNPMGSPPRMAGLGFIFFTFDHNFEQK